MKCCTAGRTAEWLCSLRATWNKILKKTRAHKHTHRAADFQIHSFTYMKLFFAQITGHVVRFAWKAVWQALEATLRRNNCSGQRWGWIQMDLAEPYRNLLPVYTTHACVTALMGRPPNTFLPPSYCRNLGSFIIKRHTDQKFLYYQLCCFICLLHLDWEPAVKYFCVACEPTYSQFREEIDSQGLSCLAVYVSLAAAQTKHILCIQSAACSPTSLISLIVSDSVARHTPMADLKAHWYFAGPPGGSNSQGEWGQWPPHLLH